MSNQGKGEENVECARCGSSWYSRKFQEENKLPSRCPDCYQESVREIPTPPTKIEETINISKNKINSIPGKIQSQKESIRDFKETHRALIQIFNMGMIISIITLVIIYIIFMR